VRDSQSTSCTVGSSSTLYNPKFKGAKKKHISLLFLEANKLGIDYFYGSDGTKFKIKINSDMVGKGFQQYFLLRKKNPMSPYIELQNQNFYYI
jgi:hypothetical protein